MARVSKVKKLSVTPNIWAKLRVSIHIEGRKALSFRITSVKLSDAAEQVNLAEFLKNDAPWGEYRATKNAIKERLRESQPQ